MGDVGDIGKFLETHELAKLTEEEIDHLSSPIPVKEVKSMVKNLHTKKILGPYGFLGEVRPTRKAEITTNSTKMPWENRKHFLTHCIRLALFRY